jgi:O-antigen ligase
MKRWLLALTGVLLLLAPLKFGAPVNLQSLVSIPGSGWEWVFWSWPNQLGVMAAAILFFLVASERLQPVRIGALGILPAIFLGTQVLAMPMAICAQTALDTLLHFGACAAVFYAAARCAREESGSNWIVGALAAATLLVCASALEQRFGGLEATRRFAAENAGVVPHWAEAQAKLASGRVFGTLVYPNALAGFLALVFAPVLAWLWSKAEGAATKWGVCGVAGGVMLACLVFSGSRGGLVAAVVGGLVWILFRKCSVKRWVVILLASAGVGLVLVVLSGGGLVKFSRSSLAARLDYWGGAVRIVRDYPWFGTGPGTFGSIYPKYKTAATEEAQLVHNNFLEMWSDSGVAAFVVFAAMWGVGLWEAARVARRRGDAMSGALVAALAAWSVHGLLDFDLYVPGVAWPAFALLGVVQGLRVEEPPVGVSRVWRLRAVCAGLSAAAVFWICGRAVAAVAACGEKNFVAACEFAPRDPQYWSRIGDATWLQRDGTAVLCFERAVALDPMRAAHHASLAFALGAMGRMEEAAKEFGEAARLNPTKRGYAEMLQKTQESVRQKRDESGKVPSLSGEKKD